MLLRTEVGGAAVVCSRSSKRNIVLFVTAFLFCGGLHVLCDGVGFAECFSQLFCGTLTLLWALSVQKRITDFRLRRLMLEIAACILLYFILQIMRYRLFDGNVTAKRYLWYAYYIPMVSISLLSFPLALYIHWPKEKPLPAAFGLLVAVGALLTLGVLTNDLHFWAFRFPSGMGNGDGQTQREWLYYLFMIFVLSVFILSYSIVLKKCRKYVGRGLRHLPLLPVFAQLLYAILYIFDTDPRIGSIHLWNLGEMFGICTIGFLETCIQTGMIPANQDYEKLFSETRLPAVILDANREPDYRTAGAQVPLPESEDIQVMRHPISGGSIEWTVDMRQVQGLNQQLEDAAQQMEARNAYLQEETRIKQEKAELETRNRLYDNISRIVQPQFAEIDELLNSREGLEQKLPRIAVLNAYVKRRSNMELLASTGLLPQGELAAAVTESLEYMQLCGVHAAVSSFGTGAFPAEMVIAAYEHFESIVEESLETLSHMNVTVRAEKKDLILRMLLKADNFAYESNGLWQDGASFSRRVAITKDQQDMIIVLTFTEGGGHT